MVNIKQSIINVLYSPTYLQWGCFRLLRTTNIKGKQIVIVTFFNYTYYGHKNPRIVFCRFRNLLYEQLGELRARFACQP